MHVHARKAIDPSASRAASVAARLDHEIARAVIGQETAVHELLIGILAGGHCLLTGPSGVGKSRVARAAAAGLGLPLVEVAGAPDAAARPLPDACVIVMDEIARTAPTVRLAWLGQAPRHAIVLATHNPHEQPAWPLTEAERDRFMLSTPFDYPTAEEERDLLRGAARPAVAPRQVVEPGELAQARADVLDVPAASNVIEYAARLARSTRPSQDGEAPDFVQALVTSGAGPRGALALIAAARAHALIDGAAAVSLDDVDAVASAVLRHRLIVSEAARLQRLTADDVISRILPRAREQAG